MRFMCWVCKAIDDFKLLCINTKRMEYTDSVKGDIVFLKETGKLP